jgi:hypothetical protein
MTAAGGAGRISHIGVFHDFTPEVPRQRNVFFKMICTLVGIIVFPRDTYRFGAACILYTVCMLYLHSIHWAFLCSWPSEED